MCQIVKQILSLPTLLHIPFMKKFSFKILETKHFPGVGSHLKWIKI